MAQIEYCERDPLEKNAPGFIPPYQAETTYPQIHIHISLAYDLKFNLTVRYITHDTMYILIGKIRTKDYTV